MTEFNLRSDAVDVEQIMRQIRARIREKRGVDYTEEEIRQLASVKLEKFLEPGGVRSDLVEQFRRQRAEPSPPPSLNYAFEDDTLFTSHRGLIRAVRRLLQPVLKLFINPGPLIHVLHQQSVMNTQVETRLHDLERKREEMHRLYFEVLHNLVLEMTRLGIEVKNMKMRVESMSSRLDFDERRSRALEGAVQYKPGAVAPPPAPGPSGGGAAPGPSGGGAAPGPSGGGPVPGPSGGGAAPEPEGGGDERRRRRRRRRRRGGQGHGAPPGAPPDAHARPATDHAAPPAPASSDEDADPGPPEDPDGPDQ